MESHQPRLYRSAWLFWVGLGITLALTLGLIGLVIWLVVTQNLTQLSVIVSLLASIIAIVSAPLIFYFTVFKKPEKQEALSPPQTHPSEKLWNVPYPRNPFFTGREDALAQIHARLTNSKAIALIQSQAISGLGGIGKTQIALEYAYRHRNEYTAVLWLPAQSPETMLTAYLTLADLLHLPLPEKDEYFQTRLVARVKQWFVQHDQWLLILDNADHFQAISTFIPTGGQGHLLLTTREQTISTLASMNIEKMSQEEGIAFLLRRSRLLPLDNLHAPITQQDRLKAEKIVQALDGLPLALDQAGAYLEEIPSCSLSDYLAHYQQQQQKYLARRGETSTDHTSVTATFLLCFTKVSEQSTLAADLLRCLAFLDPDDVPEALLQAGAVELGPHLEIMATDPSLLGEAISELLRYSLISYNKERQACSMHRLVQTVLIDEMPAEEQQQWVERVVRAINHSFPSGDITTWQQCQRYLPHAQRGLTWIEQHNLSIPEAASLLNRLGNYLVSQALYTEAEPLLKRALAISEQALGPNHPDTAGILINLAELYSRQALYTEAEPLLKRVLAISEQALGPNHPDTAFVIDRLAAHYENLGDYQQAESLMKRALAIDEQTLGPNHPTTAVYLVNLAVLYYKQGDDQQAEPLLKRGLAISEQTLGPNHPTTAGILVNLAILYFAQSDDQQAEPLLKRALAINEQKASTSGSLDSLAGFYKDQGKYKQAEMLYQRALAIRERTLGSDHPYTAISLINLAGFYRDQGKYKQAEMLYQRALVIQEKTLNPEHLSIIAVHALVESMKRKGKGRP